jgi:predicted dehydrogenase
MTNATLRVGIVGAGGNTKAKHIPGLRAIENVEITGVCNRSRASSEAVAAEFGIPRVFDDWRKLVEDPDIDAVVIGTWPYMHGPVSIAALEAGKHVLCEARMAMTAREAHDMLHAARSQPHLVAQVVPSPFTLKVDRTIQRLLTEGFIGNLLAIDVQDRGGFLDLDGPISWRQDIQLSGMNVMMLGIWYEAVMRWVGEATSVMAMGKTFVKRRLDTEEKRQRAVLIPEHVDVIADMACGAQAHFCSTRVAGHAGPSGCRLYGSDGTLRFEDGRLFGGRRDDAQLTEIAIPATEEGRWRVEEAFVNAIRGLEPVRLTTFEDGVRYMEFTEAVYRSRQTGMAIPLPLIAP